MAKHADAAGRELKEEPAVVGGDSDENPAETEHTADDAEETLDVGEDRGDDEQPGDERDDPAKRPIHKRLSSGWSLVAVSVAALAALGGVAGWQGYRLHQLHQVQAQRNELLEAARQGAVNLTTIDYTRVDADIQRILDSSTGIFHDDFQKRSQPFIDVVKKVQSKSAGTITAAGLESQTGDQAQALVTLSVKTSTAAVPQQDPRSWRMRISVQRIGNTTKVSDVQFVP